MDIIYSITDVYIAARPGINTREQVEEYTKIADGAIIGSAIVKIIEKYGENAGKNIYNYVLKITKNIKK